MTQARCRAGVFGVFRAIKAAGVWDVVRLPPWRGCVAAVTPSPQTGATEYGERVGQTVIAKTPKTPARHRLLCEYGERAGPTVIAETPETPARHRLRHRLRRLRCAMGLALGLAAAPAGAEVFVELGAQSARVQAKIANVAGKMEETETGVHLGIGAARSVGERHEIGVRLELDRLGSDTLLAVRALDYRRHVTERFAISAFLGAARLDLATPAYGYYLGTGVQLKALLPGWDLGLDLRYGDKVARDNVLPSDPQGGSPDNFYDITGVSVYLRHRF